MIKERAKQKKEQIKNNFPKELVKGLREHKVSFLVFNILRLLVIVVLIRQLLRQNYESAFFCILTMLLLYVPSWLQVQLDIELPQPLEITVLCFIFAAEILGEVDAFYLRIPFWDMLLHTINGFLAAGVGFSLAMLLNNRKRVVFSLSPAFLAVTAFCFSMTIGVLWELFEFGMDFVFHTDMQKDTIVQALYSVTLDPEQANHVVAVTDIQNVAINGLPLNLGGYLDIGLIDTMEDLLVNFIGATVFSVIGFLCISGKKSLRKVMMYFVPHQKSLEESKDNRKI